jgi:hypothetical protein
MSDPTIIVVVWVPMVLTVSHDGRNSRSTAAVVERSIISRRKM